MFSSPRKPSTNNPNPNPLWKVVDVVLALGILFTILLFSANRFDNTELEQIGWFAAIYTIVQGGNVLAKKFF